MGHMKENERMIICIISVLSHMQNMSNDMFSCFVSEKKYTTPTENTLKYGICLKDTVQLLCIKKKPWNIDGAITFAHSAFNVWTMLKPPIC